MKAKRPEECNAILGKAFNSKDIDQVMELFEEGAIFTDQSGKEHIGLDAIEKAEQKVIDMNPTFSIKTLGVSETGGIAVLCSSWMLEGTDQSGKKIHLQHHGIEVVKKQKDGS